MPFTAATEHKTDCHQNHAANPTTTTICIDCLLSSLYSLFRLIQNAGANAVGGFYFQTSVRINVCVPSPSMTVTTPAISSASNEFYTQSTIHVTSLHWQFWKCSARGKVRLGTKMFACALIRVFLPSVNCFEVGKLLKALSSVLCQHNLVC